MPARTVVPAVLVLVALLAVLLTRSGHHGRELSMTIADASYLLPGSPVREAGQDVGEVVSAKPTRDGRARVRIHISDGRAWPLTTETTLRLRWRGTIAYSGRYIEIDRSTHALGEPLPDHGVVAAARVIEPVEVDQVLGTFDAATRRNLPAALQASGQALNRAATPLQRVLGEAPPALGQARALINDLGGDPLALDTLVRSSDRVVGAMRAANPGVRALVDGAATTFASIADGAADLRGLLAAAPDALSGARRTLAQADGTLDGVDTLAARLSPGVTELRQLAAPLSKVLTTVDRVGPDARATLNALHRATPDLNPLLTKLRTLAPQLTSVANQATKQLNCIRPYTPEIAGVASTWSGFQTYGDGKDKYARVSTPVFPFDQLPISSADAQKLFPGLTYAFPRPPGEVAGQPWFLPECGVGPDSMTAADDPETAR